MKTYYIENGSEYATIVQTDESVHELTIKLERGRYSVREYASAETAQLKLEERGKMYTPIDSWYK